MLNGLQEASCPGRIAGRGGEGGRSYSCCLQGHLYSSQGTLCPFPLPQAWASRDQACLLSPDAEQPLIPLVEPDSVWLSCSFSISLPLSLLHAALISLLPLSSCALTRWVPSNATATVFLPGAVAIAAEPDRSCLWGMEADFPVAQRGASEPRCL